MKRIFFVTFVLVYCILNVHGRSEKFEVIVEGVTKCPSPHPPFAKKPSILTTYNLRKRKEKMYFSGQHLVMEDTPFLNFSASTYGLSISGKQDLKTVLENLSCHNWISKAYLTMGKIRYSKKDCRVRKGTYGFNDIDINATFHSLPNYHDKGRLIHKLILVHNGSTVFCNELRLTII